MPVLPADSHRVRSMNPGHQVIDDVRRPSCLVQISEALVVAPSRESGDAIPRKAGGGGSIIRYRVGDLNGRRTLARDRAVAFVAVAITVGEVVQQRRTEDVIPVETVHPGIFGIGRVRSAELYRQRALLVRLRVLPPDGDEEMILIAPVMIDPIQIVIQVGEDAVGNGLRQEVVVWPGAVGAGR